MVAAAAGVVFARELVHALEYLLASNLHDVVGERALYALQGCSGLITALMAWSIAEYALSGRDQKLLRMRVYRITAGSALLFTFLGFALASRVPIGDWPPAWRELSVTRQVVFADRSRQSPKTPCVAHASPAYLALRRGDPFELPGQWTIRRHARSGDWNDWEAAVAYAAGSFRADRSGWYAVEFPAPLCVQLKP